MGEPCSAVPEHTHRRAGAGEREPEKTREGEARSERRNARAAGQRELLLEREQLDHGRGRQEPQGPLATLLNLDILPSLVSDTTTLESSEGEDYSGQEGGGPGGSGQG